MTSRGRHAPKTRSACQTCKKRKVKCDLARPSCARCLKAGRICEGYQLAVVKGIRFSPFTETTLPHLTASSSLLSSFRATQPEWQAYGFYNRKVASILGGSFDTELWKRLVLQVAETEPTVRYGIFALGNLFRHHVVSKGMSDCGCAHCRQTLRHYNKSITSFSQYLQKPASQQTPEVALLSCIIFICLEFYQMNDKNALSLISKGCDLLAESMRQKPDSRTAAINPIVIKSFERLWLLSSMFGRHFTRPLSGSSEVSPFHPPDRMETIEAARDILYEILRLVQSLRLRVFQAQFNTMPASERAETIEMLKIEQHSALLLLETWRNGLQFLMDRKVKQSAEHTQACSILLVQYTITKIRASASMDPAEKDEEDRSEEFRCLVTAAGEGLARISSEEDARSFSFESCFLPALFLTARQCRDSNIRRKALELMRLAGTKEGLWCQAELTCIAARVIDLEEGLVTFGLEHPHEATPEKPLRFYDVWAGLSYRHGGKRFVDVTYVLYDLGCIPPWRSMSETLTVPD